MQKLLNTELSCPRKLGQALGTIRKLLMNGISWGDFIIFTPNMGEILNFEKKLSLEIQFKFQILFSQLNSIL
jgi:hypothetical protein